MSDRRTFLKGSLIAAMAMGTAQAQTETRSGVPSPDQWISIIDLARCDGCQGQAIPACVAACREKNHTRFPEPEKPLKPYWPQKTYEDFSNQRDRIDRLTPYNWIYVEKVSLSDGKTVYAPRRCMHCFDAPCRKICPFGAIDRSEQGAVQIDPDVCFGGAGMFALGRFRSARPVSDFTWMLRRNLRVAASCISVTSVRRSLKRERCRHALRIVLKRP